MSRSSIELLRATRQGHPDCDDLAKLTYQVDQLEAMLEVEGDEDLGCPQLNTIIDFLLYRAIHLHGDSDLEQLRQIEAGFKDLLAGDLCLYEREEVARFLAEEVRSQLTEG